MSTELDAKIKELEESPEFAQKLIAATTPEKIISLFKEYGLTVTEEDAPNIVKAVSDELTEDDLAAIAGGANCLNCNKKGVNLIHIIKCWILGFRG